MSSLSGVSRLAPFIISSKFIFIIFSIPIPLIPLSDRSHFHHLPISPFSSMAFNFPCNFNRQRRPPPADKTLLADEIFAASRTKKTRSLLDIDWNNASTPGVPPPAIATDFAAPKGLNRRGFAGKVPEDAKERKRRRWEALLDAAAIAVIREYQGNLGREDIEYRAESRIRNPGKWSGGCAVVNSWSGRDRRLDIGGYDVEATVAAAAPVMRSKRGRVVALPNRYKDTILTVGEEFPRRGKSAEAAADEKSGGALNQ